MQDDTERTAGDPKNGAETAVGGEENDGRAQAPFVLWANVFDPLLPCQQESGDLFQRF